jgi:lipopolysaccharide/colanic/teichoic acid biosynthesis glycosyltransferase
VKVLAFVVSAVLVPMLVGEFADWLPWLAERLVGAAARALPPAVRLRYTAEWLGELDAVPGKLSKLAVAVRIFVRAPATAAAIRGLPSLSYRAIAIKTLFDKLLAASALALLAPLFVIIALAIKLTDHGPVFIRQTRIGKDGQPFTAWKFRTMEVRAGGQLLQLSGVDENGTPFKWPPDPQLTGVGAWLQRWSLDELPQWLNVLSGDLSVVGGRPVLPAEIAGPGDQTRYEPAAKPGLTGLWQIGRRPGLSRHEAARRRP